MNKIAHNRLVTHFLRVAPKQWKCLHCAEIVSYSRRSMHLRSCNPAAYKSLIRGQKYDNYEPAARVGRKGKKMGQQSWFLELRKKMQEEGIIRR